MDNMPVKGDKPRKIVVCHPDRYVEVQRAVIALGYGDVLVQRNRYVPSPDTCIVIDGGAFLDPAPIQMRL